MKHRARLFLQHVALYTRRRPLLKRVVLHIFRRVPGLRARLFSVATGMPPRPIQRAHVPTELAQLTPRARQIHADLKSALARRQQEHA